MLMNNLRHIGDFLLVHWLTASSAYKADVHDIIEILLKVALTLTIKA